jgi:hypothetical protein
VGGVRRTKQEGRTTARPHNSSESRWFDGFDENIFKFKNRNEIIMQPTELHEKLFRAMRLMGLTHSHQSSSRVTEFLKQLQGIVVYAAQGGLVFREAMASWQTGYYRFGKLSSQILIAVLLVCDEWADAINVPSTAIQSQE